MHFCDRLLGHIHTTRPRDVQLRMEAGQTVRAAAICGSTIRSLEGTSETARTDPSGATDVPHRRLDRGRSCVAMSRARCRFVCSRMKCSSSARETRIAFPTLKCASAPRRHSPRTPSMLIPNACATSRAVSGRSGTSPSIRSVYSKDTARTFHLLASGCTGLLGGAASNAVFIEGCTGLQMSVPRKSRPTNPKASPVYIALHGLALA